MTETYVIEVLRIFQDADVYDGLVWQVAPSGTVQFAATCSDTFWWGSADAETIKPDDVDLLRQCLVDLRAAGDEDYLICELFAARKRGMRPMRLWLKTLETPRLPDTQDTIDLFLAAGPERDPNDEG